jgi:hypothetical protein
VIAAAADSSAPPEPARSCAMNASSRGVTWRLQAALAIVDD